MSALPKSAWDVAFPSAAVPIGPVPDTFITAMKRSWMVPAPVKTSEPNPVDVAALVENSRSWTDHDRAQECVRICHKHPLLWQEFLFQERVEKKKRERNSKRAREVVDAVAESQRVTQEKQQALDEVTRHFASSSPE